MKSWIIAGLFVFVLVAMIGWMRAGEERPLHIPPDLSHGATVRVGDVPKPTLYSFAYYLLQAAYYCQSDCSVEYPQRIKQFTPYLSDQMRSYLQHDLQLRQQNNTLYQRSRMLLPLQGGGSEYSADKVKRSGDGWIVWLDFRLREQLGSSVVKDDVLRFPVRVVPYDFSRQYNEWGLALDGYEREPYRVQ